MKNKASKLAFTLYELVIAMALAIIVIGCVISFVVFMNSYNTTNQQQSDTINGYADLRTKIDAWFSEMDYEDESSYVHICDYDADATYGYYVWFGDESSSYEEADYYIKSVLSSGGTTFYFASPSASGETESGDKVNTLTLSLDCVLRIQEINDDYKYSEIDNVELYFTINMPVCGREFLCEIIKLA